MFPLNFQAEENEKQKIDALTAASVEEHGYRTPPSMSPPRQPPPLKPGFRYRLKRERSLARTQYKDARTHPIDICFENPLDGAFKYHEGIVALLNDAKGLIVTRPTSYCHYGVDHRKRTLFITSVLAFQPTPPCPVVLCEALRGKPTQMLPSAIHKTELDLEDCIDAVAPRPRHPNTIANLGTEERNRIPFELLKELIYAWCKQHLILSLNSDIELFLILDVFSGWGSLTKLVDSMHAQGKWGKIVVYSNDIVRRDHTDMEFDMTSTSDSLRVLLRFALQKYHFGVLQDLETLTLRDALWKHKVALLVHVSTPCETYSVDGLGVHRRRQTTSQGPVYLPITQAAHKADLMNSNILRWVRSECGLV